METIEVIDTAIKIGLGAAITGVAGLIAASRAHSREIDKLLLVRRLDAIEELAKDASKAFQEWRVMFMAMGPIYAGNPATPNASLEKWLQLVQVDQGFFAGREQQSSILARLRLLKLDDARKLFAGVINRYAEFRDKTILNRTLLNSAEFEILKSTLRSDSAKFFDKLAAKYP